MPQRRGTLQQGTSQAPMWLCTSHCLDGGTLLCLMVCCHKEGEASTFISPRPPLEISSIMMTTAVEASKPEDSFQGVTFPEIIIVNETQSNITEFPILY